MHNKPQMKNDKRAKKNEKKKKKSDPWIMQIFPLRNMGLICLSIHLSRTVFTLLFDALIDLCISSGADLSHLTLV